MKLNVKKFGGPDKSFLAIPDHYVNVTGLYNCPNGENLKAGTVVKITEAGVVTKAASNDGNGIVFNDTQVNNSGGAENQVVTVLIHGFVRKTRLDSTTAEHLVTTGLITVVE